MTHRRWRLLLAVPLALAVAAVTSPGSNLGARTASADVLSKLDPRLRAHVSGTVALELGGLAPQAQAQVQSTYFPVGDDGCPSNVGGNVKVNQNCLNVADSDLQGRSQSQNETSVAIDPNDPRHVVASYNDYRRGDGTCGTSFSLDAGRTWTDSTAPNGFTRGDLFGPFARQYWQAGGDTSVAWDTRGNAYLSCQVFQRGQPTTTNPDLSSGFVIFRSTRNNGASWSFPARYSTIANDLAASGAILEDKALMTVDGNATSPFRDRIYVTWTEYTATTAYIYEVASADFGQTFGPRHLISVASSLCPSPISGAGGGCDNNQFSQPFVGPDGTLYVVWVNYNTVDFGVANPGPARFQVLVTASRDGGATFSAPRRAGFFYEVPDCATYTALDPGRGCIPEKGATNNSIFRVANYPAAAVNPRNPREVAVSFPSYINQHSNESNGCVPEGSVAASAAGLYTGVKRPGACKNDILLSVSTNGGASFTGTNTDPRRLQTATTPAQATSDQWFQWLAYDRQGRLAVSYYDRQYGSDEATGFSDFSLSGSSDLEHFAVTRVTSSSLPPPTQFSGLFWGDYTGLDVRGSAFPIWSDTRSRDLFVCPSSGTGPGNPPRLCGLQDFNGVANDQDIFASGIPVPTG